MKIRALGPIACIVCATCLVVGGCAQREQDPQRRLRQAREYLKAGDYRLAMWHASEAVALQPDFGAAYMVRAEIYARQGLLAMALDDYARALNSPEERREALRRRGIIFRRIGKYTEAVSAYAQMIREGPDQADGYMGRAQVLIKQERFEQARQDLRRAEELVPDDARIAVARGRLHEAERAFPQALREYERAVEMDRRNVEAQVLLGTLHARENRISEGLAAYGVALQIDPGRGDLYYKRSFLHLANGEYEAALDDTVRARFLGEEVDARYIARIKRQAAENAGSDAAAK